MTNGYGFTAPIISLMLKVLTNILYMIFFPLVNPTHILLGNLLKIKNPKKTQNALVDDSA